MSLRTFVDAVGARWSVWETEASKPAPLVSKRQRCLSFVDGTGVERGRLFDVPPNWEELSGKRLEALFEYAQPVMTRKAFPLEVGDRLDERTDGGD